MDDLVGTRIGIRKRLKVDDSFFNPEFDLSTIPDEIIAIILGYMTELCRRKVERVCKQFFKVNRGFGNFSVSTKIECAEDLFGLSYVTAKRKGSVHHYPETLQNEITAKDSFGGEVKDKLSGFNTLNIEEITFARKLMNKKVSLNMLVTVGQCFPNIKRVYFINSPFESTKKKDEKDKMHLIKNALKGCYTKLEEFVVLKQHLPQWFRDLFPGVKFRVLANPGCFVCKEKVDKKKQCPRCSRVFCFKCSDERAVYDKNDNLKFTVPSLFSRSCIDHRRVCLYCVPKMKHCGVCKNYNYKANMVTCSNKYCVFQKEGKPPVLFSIVKTKKKTCLSCRSTDAMIRCIDCKRGECGFKCGSCKQMFCKKCMAGHFNSERVGVCLTCKKNERKIQREQQRRQQQEGGEEEEDEGYETQQVDCGVGRITIQKQNEWRQQRINQNRQIQQQGQQRIVGPPISLTPMRFGFSQPVEPVRIPSPTELQSQQIDQSMVQTGTTLPMLYLWPSQSRNENL